MLAQLPTALRDLRLPLRLKLWDGKQIDLGPKPRVTLVVKDPTLVMQLATPAWMHWALPMSRDAWISKAPSKKPSRLATH